MLWKGHRRVGRPGRLGRKVVQILSFEELRRKHLDDMKLRHLYSPFMLDWQDNFVKRSDSLLRFPFFLVFVGVVYRRFCRKPSERCCRKCSDRRQLLNSGSCSFQIRVRLNNFFDRLGLKLCWGEFTNGWIKGVRFLRIILSNYFEIAESRLTGL